MIELALLVIGLVIGVMLGWLWLAELFPTSTRIDPAMQAELNSAKAGLSAKSAELERARKDAAENARRVASIPALERELGELRGAQGVGTTVGGNGSVADDAESALSKKDARISELERKLAECRQRSAAPPISELAPGITIAGVAAPIAGVEDDLKEIRGVGPVLEKALKGYGIVTFKQLADLDAAGIAAVEEAMTEFPGRMTRDDWVAQAAELHAKHHG